MECQYQNYIGRGLLIDDLRPASDLANATEGGFNCDPRGLLDQVNLGVIIPRHRFVSCLYQFR